MKITNRLDANGYGIKNLADAVDPQDAATKAQLDAAIQGFKWKEPVRVATTGAITLSGLQTIDDVAVIAGDRVLVKAQGAGADNSVYVAAAGAWARATDFDAASEVLGAAVFVSEGTAHGNQQWILTTNAPIVVGTTALTWSQVGGGASYSAGNGISIAGGVIAVDTAVVARKASATIGNATDTTISVTHNLGTKDVMVSVREASGDAGVLCDWVASDVNTVQLTFGAAPSTGQYRATIMG